MVQGIRLLGGCPTTLPTDTFPYTITYLNENIIRAVSFSPETPSHLFRDIPYDLMPGYKVTMDVDELTLRFNYQTPDTIVVASIRYDGHAQSHILNSSIYQVNASRHHELQRMKCQPSIVEEVKLWIDEYFLFLWSCANTTHHGFHEEAVIVLDLGNKFYTFYKKPLKAEVILKRLHSSAQKYLSDPLFNQIDWSLNEYDFDPTHDYPTASPLACPIVSVFTSKGSFVMFGAIVVLVLAVICVAIFHSLKLMSATVEN